MEVELLSLAIKNALLKNEVVLVILPADNYRHNIIPLISGVCDKKICYLTCNKSSEVLINEIETHGVKKGEFFFLDCVSKQADLYDGSLPYMFLESPADLDELFVVSAAALKKKFNFFVLDSINSLFSHNVNKEAEAVSFVEKIANKVRISKTKTILLALDIPTQRAFIDEIAVFVDKVLDFSKEQE